MNRGRRDDASGFLFPGHIQNVAYDSIKKRLQRNNPHDYCKLRLTPEIAAKRLKRHKKVHQKC